MAHRVRPAAHGGDRRFGRSLAETLMSGKKPDTVESFAQNMSEGVREVEPFDPEAFEYWHEANPDEGTMYDEASGPTRTTRRPVHNEWEPYTIMDVYNRSRGQEG